MKKLLTFLFPKYCILSLSLIIFTRMNAQQDFDKYMPSPNISEIGNYGLIPISYYTGRAEVTIPLLSDNALGKTLDVSLSYDGGGVLMNALPGWVGHNWSLLAGGVVTRQVVREPDEYVEPEHFKYFFHSMEKNKYTPFQNYYKTYKKDAVELCTMDPSADIFYFSFMGMSGSFFFDSDGSWKVDCEKNVSVLFDVEDESNYISPFIAYYPYDYENKTYLQPKTIKGFTLIDDEGTRYVFGSGKGQETTEAIEYSMPFSGGGDLEYAAYWTATSWYLSEVINREGVMLYKFKYKRGYFVTHSTPMSGHYETKTSSTSQNIVAHPKYSLSLTSPVYLESIASVNGMQAEFVYDNAFSTDSVAYPSMYKELYSLSSMFLNTEAAVSGDYSSRGKLCPERAGGTEENYYFYLNDTRFHEYHYPITSRRIVRGNLVDPLQYTGLKYLKQIKVKKSNGESEREVNLGYSHIGPRMHLTDVSMCSPTGVYM